MTHEEIRPNKRYVVNTPAGTETISTIRVYGARNAWLCVDELGYAFFVLACEFVEPESPASRLLAA